MSWPRLGGLTLVLLLLPAALPAPAASAPIPQVPCGDPRGCPDIVVDGPRFLVGTQRTETFGPNSCAVREGMVQAGQRQLLRFTFNSPNVGRGDLKIGAPRDHPEWFEFAGCHGHFHFREYADYRLWTVEGFLAWDALRRADPERTPSEVLAAHPELLASLTVQDKRGFCVVDVLPAGPTADGAAVPPDPLPKYGDCDDDQGISRGWADEYTFLLDGQWVDVTGLASGPYVLEAEVNAERLYTESSYANNRAFLPVVVAANL